MKLQLAKLLLLATGTYAFTQLLGVLNQEQWLNVFTLTVSVAGFYNLGDYNITLLQRNLKRTKELVAIQEHLDEAKRRLDEKGKNE